MTALQAAQSTAQLQRATMRTSRLLDFCSRKELIAQTGHQPEVWPLVLLKELVDNALDACEEATVVPITRRWVPSIGMAPSSSSRRKALCRSSRR